MFHIVVDKSLNQKGSAGARRKRNRRITLEEGRLLGLTCGKAEAAGAEVENRQNSKRIVIILISHIFLLCTKL
jgi:cysteine synthase